jgi:serine/threonine protein kinase
MSAQSKTPEPDLSGQTLDRYHLLRRLGIGGMGAVYEAEHTRLRKRFAVKLLRYEFAQDETFRKRFLREARAASAISHPNVVSISDFGETPDDHVFFVMDLLAGRDLQELLDAETKLPWPRAREILLQVTSALQAAHMQDIIHRDIKPSNVFLADIPGKADEDVVKVLDFGIAKLSGNMGAATVKLTSTDEIFGTVAYMAPEMAMGINDDRRSDIYAVGVMMYRMLTGELPFTQGNAFQILSQHINAPVPAPRAKDPSIPADVEAILLKALAKDPNDRLASMEDFGRALRRGSLDAMEALVGMPAALLVGQPKLSPGSASTSIDKTTPLPSRGVPGVPQQPTEVSSPIVLQASDSLAAPLGEAPTEVSTPIAVGPSDSLAAPVSSALTAVSTPISTTASRSVAQPASNPAATLDSSRLASNGEIEAQDRKRSSLWFAIPVAVAVLAAGLTFLVLDSRESETTPGTQEASLSPPPASEPSPSPTPSMGGEPTRKAEPSAAPMEPQPEPGEQEQVPAGSDPRTDEAPEPPVDPPTAADPPVETTPEPADAKQPKRSGPPKPKPKPKSDQDVANALKAKILSKCKAKGDTKVKVEGVISSSGTVSPYITPATELGACAKKIVSAAKFDAAGGVRPMPRFSVEL